jgi:4'-phosphopantetheinyl transferase
MKMLSEYPIFLLKPGEVHVWLFDLDDLGQGLPVWEQLLSEDEIWRSKRYHFEQDRQRFVARRGLLRQLLGHYCGTAPEEITYRTNQFGKLSMSSQPVHFNLSASQNRVAFAFTLGKEVGVDIEQVRLLPELDRMAEHWFSPAERVSLFALSPEMQLDAFYHVWTQKEAFIKAHGEGLSLPLQDFSVSVDPDLPGRLLSIRDDAEEVSVWKMDTGAPVSGWRIAVCFQTESEQEIRWYMPDIANFLSVGGYVMRGQH